MTETTSHASRMLLHQLRASVALEKTAVMVGRLEALPHQHMQVGEMSCPVDDDGFEGVDHCQLALFAGVDDHNKPRLTLYIEPQLGRQARYLDLRPSEARELIARLTSMVEQIEEIVHAD